jgi:hypothetical protein
MGARGAGFFPRTRQVGNGLSFAARDGLSPTHRVAPRNVVGRTKCPLALPGQRHEVVLPHHADLVEGTS